MKKIIFSILFFLAINIFGEVKKEVVKNIVKNYKDAVLTVRILQKQWTVMEGKEFTKRETKNEITGTVISEDGIIVVSGFTAEPSKFFNKMRTDSSLKFEVKSQISGIKIILPDREEIDGKVILQDEKLDLYFIKAIPEKKIKFRYINLKDSINAEIMDEVISIDRLGDEVISIDRLGNIGKREIFVSPVRVGAIMKKPRKYYILTEQIVSPGSPVFSTSGKIIGINLIKSRKTPSSVSNFSILPTFSSMGFLPVVVPAKDIFEVYEQIKIEKFTK